LAAEPPEADTGTNIQTVREHEKSQSDTELASKDNMSPSLDSARQRFDVVREYHPSVLKVEEETNEMHGTTVILEHIRPLDAIDIRDFKTRLSRKFAVFADDFKVTIVDANSRDKHIIEKFDIETQFRFPDTGLGNDKVQ